MKDLAPELPTEVNFIKLRQLSSHRDDVLYFNAVELNRDHLSRYGLDTSDKYPDFESVVEARLHPKNLYRLRMGIWVAHYFTGSANFTRIPDIPTEAEIGFWLQEKYVGRGYGKVVIRGLARYARFSGFESVTAFPSDENKPARSLLEKLSFSTDGQINHEGKIKYSLDLLNTEDSLATNPNILWE